MTDFTAERARLAERWKDVPRELRAISPFEMSAAVYRDSITDLNTVEALARYELYDRRGLLNAIVLLLNALDRLATENGT